MDGLVVAFNLLLGIGAATAAYFRSGVVETFIGVGLVQALFLWWRRSHPVIVLLLVVITDVIGAGLTPSREFASPALAFAVYAVSVYDRTAVRMWVAGVSIAIIVAAVASLFLGDFAISRSLIPAGAISLVAWVIGDYIRSRRQFFAELVARHKQARDQAAEQERLRIARELHDVVAHNVSVIAIQAGAARVAGNSSKEALQSIETTARDTLAELNRLLGVLRKESEAPRSPQPGLDQIEALLKPAREAGLEATLKIAGEKRPLPAAQDLSAYRIVQEAITNVLKHAQATRVEVKVDYEPEVLVLTISDNGSGSREAVGTSTGHGLIGMRERVELFGGELGASSSSLGGFMVRATLPLKT
jgi:signal transduction histidine kinase